MNLHLYNNIFYLKTNAKVVLGDQYKPDTQSSEFAKNVFFENNLFLNNDSWPKETGIDASKSIIGNPEFLNEGGLEAKDYIPENLDLIHYKGINIDLLPQDTTGLLQSLKLEKDILGNPISTNPSLGAIEPIH